MMIGRGISHLNPIASVPSWTTLDDLTVGNFPSSPFPLSGVINAGDCPPFDEATLASLQFNPTHKEEVDSGTDAQPMVDVFASDEFRIYDFKVKLCGRGRSHDWADCPFAHPSEKARRRDLRKHSYSGTACPDFRKPGGCKRGDACELAHGVFEYWLHPDRYRTQPCKDGTDCRRRVCFFAHTPDQLRVLQTSFLRQSAAVLESYDGSPLRHQSCLHSSFSSFSKSLVSSPTSTLISQPKSPPAESQPISPSGAKLLRASWPANSSMNEIVASLRQLQLNRAESMPSTRGLHMGKTGFVSPRGAVVGFDTAFRSLPSTPVGVTASWPDEHLAMGRVESGRALRAKMFERLIKDGIFDEAEAAPDVEWVSELLK